MNDHASTNPPLHLWLWRWHGYAGLFIVPFIFWMSLTELPYLWENELENFYLFTGLPWTAFWGGQLLATLQGITGQNLPTAMTDATGLRSVPPAPGARRLPLDAFARFALDRHLLGPMFIELPEEESGTVHVYNRLNHHWSEEHFQLDAYNGQVVGHAAWKDVPLTAQAVALGIDLHEGALLGRTTQILSTVLACAFMLVAGAGAIAWWWRRPQGRLDWPKLVPRQTLPLGLRALLVVLGLCLPLLGLSLVGLTLVALLRQARPVLQPL